MTPCPDERGRRLAGLPAWAWGLLLVAVTVVHRSLLAARTFPLPVDTGTLAWMALNILEGERPLFLYGFCYSGSPMAYLLAASFRLGGVSWVTFAAPVVLLAGLWVWLTFRLFERLGGARVGLAAALACTFADWNTSWYTLAPDTSYSALLALGTAILLLACPWLLAGRKRT